MRESVEETRLIYPARIDTLKNQIQLLGVTKRLKQKGVRVKTIVIGSCDKKIPEQRRYYESVVQYIKEHQLEDVVDMPGWLDNPWNEFGVNDIYVTSTVTESVGRATLEAVELGIPILIPDIPGHREFKEILDISNEHFYESGNMVEFAEKVEYLMSHIDEAKKRAKIYQKRAIDVFSEDNCNKNILSALESVIGKGNPAPAHYTRELLNDNLAKQVHIRNIEAELAHLRIENLSLSNEIASHMGIKRSTKLTLGNIKRRIKNWKNR
jgi:glycosyltransferase involved in cell wall biosynthesis